MASLEVLTRNVEMMKALPMNIGFLLVPSEGTHLLGVAIRHGSVNLLDFMIDNLVGGDFTQQMLNTIAVPRDASRSRPRTTDDTSVIGDLYPGDGILMMMIRSRLIPSEVKIRCLRKLSRLGLKISLDFSDPVIKSLDQAFRQDLVRLVLETININTQDEVPDLVPSPDEKAISAEVDTSIEVATSNEMATSAKVDVPAVAKEYVKKSKIKEISDRVETKNVDLFGLMSNDALVVTEFFLEKMMNEILTLGYSEMIKSRNFWMTIFQNAVAVNSIPAVSKWFELKNFIEPEAWLSDWKQLVAAELLSIQLKSEGYSFKFDFTISDELRDELIDLWKSNSADLIKRNDDLVRFYWKYGNQQLLAEIMASPLSYQLYRYVILSRWEMICQRQEIVDRREVVLSSDFKIDSDSDSDSDFKSLKRRAHLVELEMDLATMMTKEEVLQNGQELLLLLKQFHGNMGLVNKLLKNLAQVGFSEVEFIDLQIFSHPDRDLLIGALLDSFPSVSSDSADLDLNLIDYRRLSQMDCILWKTYWLHSSNVGRLKNTEDLISFDDLSEMNDASFVVLSRVAWDLDNLTEYVLQQTNGQNKYDSAFKTHGLDGLPIWTGDEFVLLSRHPKAVKLVETFQKLEMISQISERTINELKNCLAGFDSTSPYFQELFAMKFPKKSVASLSDEKQAVIESEALSQLYLYLNGLDGSEVAMLKLLHKSLSHNFIKDVMTGKECLAMFNRVMTSAISTWEEFTTKKAENVSPKTEMKFQMRFDPIEKTADQVVSDSIVAIQPDTSGDYALAMLLSKQEDSPQASPQTSPQESPQASPLDDEEDDDSLFHHSDSDSDSDNY